MEIYIVFIALFLSFSLHFIIQSLFFKLKRFDDFNHRTSHNTIATRTGGISIFISLFLISVAHYLLKIELFDYSLFIPLSILFTIGVYDDLYQADFKLKFLMQIIVAKILIDQGHVITSLHGFLGIYEMPWILSQFITAITFILIVNAYNFIDGIDGLAISETLKNLCFFLYFFNSDDQFYSLVYILLFVCIPFYYFNLKKRKKVFLGDAGSLFLGGVNIVFFLHLLNPSTGLELNYDRSRLLLVSVMLFYPLFDLIRVVMIRIKNKKSPFNADQNHIHHWIVNKGISHIKASFLITTIGAVITLINILI